MTLETCTGIICATTLVVIYIIRKVSGDMWYGINWQFVFKHIRKLFS